MKQPTFEEMNEAICEWRGLGPFKKMNRIGQVSERESAVWRYLYRATSRQRAEAICRIIKPELFES